MDDEILGEQKNAEGSSQNRQNPFAAGEPEHIPISRSLTPVNGLKNIFSAKVEDVTDRTFGAAWKNLHRASEDNTSVISEQQNEKPIEKPSNDLNDEQNFKRSIELLNGQPVRNARNIIKNSNRMELGLYHGFKGFLWLLLETIFRFDHFLIGI